MQSNFMKNFSHLSSSHSHKEERASLLTGIIGMTESYCHIKIIEHYEISSLEGLKLRKGLEIV